MKNAVSREEVIKLLSDLISIPSHPGVENVEKKVAEYLSNVFTKEGIENQIVHVKDGRPNIMATLSGNIAGKRLLLCGHTDTVPPYDFKDPYNPKIIDGMICGRGSVDMKGPIASMVAAMVALKRKGANFAGEVVFAGVIDEEETSLGVINLLENGIKADAAIVGEPTDFDVCCAHRGLEWIKFEFIAKTYHGGKAERGANAIDLAVAFINEVNCALPKEMEKHTHPIIGSGSYNLGTIGGGTQASSVAGYCSLTLDRRWLPDEDYRDIMGQFEGVIAKLSKTVPGFACKMSIVDESVMKKPYIHAGLNTPIDDEIVKQSLYVCKELRDSAKINFFPAWSDAGLLGHYGKIPSIVLGPGDLGSAHSKHEHIMIADLIDGAEMYYNIIKKFLV